MAWVELDIVALREDDTAAVQWLDEGYTSTTMWRSISETLKARARPQLKSTASFSSARGAASEKREMRRSRTRTATRSLRSMGSRVSGDSSSFEGAEGSLATEKPAVAITSTEDVATCGGSDTTSSEPGTSSEMLFIISEDSDSCVESVDSANSDASGSPDSGKVCECCQKPYHGFGDSCGACRKVSSHGSIQQCRTCSSFFSGFMDVCDGCSLC